MRPHLMAGRLIATTARTTTGAGSWLTLPAACREFSMQCKKNTAGTSNYTVILDGALSTASTAPYAEITYTQASNNTVVRSTAGRLVDKVRYRVTVLGGTTAKSLQIHAAAMPGV